MRLMGSNLSTLNTDHCNINTIPKWDGSAIKVALFIRHLEEWLERIGYSNLPLKGFFAARNMIIVVSALTTLGVFSSRF